MRDGFVQLPKVVVHEHPRTVALDAGTHDKTLRIGGEIVEQPVVVRFSIHDVNDVLVRQSLRCDQRRL